MAIRRTSRLSTRSEHEKAGSPYSAAILFVAAVSVLGAAPVHAGEIDADVGYLASPVSLSVPGSQPVATYTVKLTNASASNVINNGRLVATTSVVGGATGAKATFKSASGATCTVDMDGTRVDCSVGSLALTQSKEFTLTFYSPSSGTNIALAWDAVFDNGTPPGARTATRGPRALPSPRSIRPASPRPFRQTRAFRSLRETLRSQVRQTNSRLPSPFPQPIQRRLLPPSSKATSPARSAAAACATSCVAFNRTSRSPASPSAVSGLIT